MDGEADDKFDRDYWAATLKLSAKQRAYCYARLDGCDQTAAARQAGYSQNGKPATQRSVASDVEHSPKVKSFFELSNATGPMAKPLERGTLEEIERKLWTQVRSHDMTAQRGAVEQLLKLGLISPKPAGAEIADPLALLRDIYHDSPEIARLLAKQNNLDISFLEPKAANVLAFAGRE